MAEALILAACAAVGLIWYALLHDLLNHMRHRHSPSPWTRRMIGGAWYCRGGRWTRTPPQDLLDPVEEVEFHPEPVGKP